MSSICILGEGAWGTAVATVLAHNGHSVRLWCYHTDVADDIRASRYNKRYMPGVLLHDSIVPVTDIKEGLKGAEFIFEALPVAYLRTVLSTAQPCYDSRQIWVVLSKGIEPTTLKLPTQILEAVFDESIKTVVVSGPSFACEVVAKQVTGVVIASGDNVAAQLIADLITNNYFKPQMLSDVIGVQTVAALKNVVTLAVGIAQGAGYSADNTKAYIVAQGIQEMLRITLAVDGKQETVYGLAGVGDLVLTALGNLSKNLFVGKQLGAGKRLEDILRETGYIPEGIHTVKSIYQLIKKHDLNVPLMAAVYEVIVNNRPVDTLINALSA